MDIDRSLKKKEFQKGRNIKRKRMKLIDLGI